ncbi:MAG: restriction endonuclease subunit S [Candidatus Pacebacteria bacterium]|nr:restriction endonuclease subunit S [Candidatus Paceibacterota bacterium]
MTSKNTQQILTGWEEATLGDYISIKHGFAFKGEYFSEQENENVLLTPGNFNIGGGFKADKLKYYIGLFPEEYILHAGDLIVTMTDLSKDGDTLGYPAKVPHYENKNFLHNQRIGLVQFKRKDLDRDFLYYLMCTRNYQKNIVNSASGSTVRHTSPDRIKEYKSLFPSFPEQRAIASVLSAFDDKIELLREQNKTLESIAQALFKRWFVDFEFPNEQGKPYKSSGGKMIDSELGEIPDGWKVGGLRDIINIYDSRRIPLSSEQRAKRKGKYPYYGATEVIDYIDDYLFEGIYLLLAEDGSVIDEEGFPVLQYVFGQFWVSNHAHVIQGKQDISTEYLYLLFKQTPVSGIITGAVQLKINQENLLSLEVIIPEKQTLKVFNSLMDSIFSKVRANILQIQTLFQLRDTLLPKLMRGEVRVKH